MASTPSAAVVLATDGPGLAEVLASQLPKIRAIVSSRGIVQLGPRDLLDGYDESYVHARLVELCDGIAREAPKAYIIFQGIPSSALDIEEPATPATRDQLNAAAEVTAALRGYHWHT